MRKMGYTYELNVEATIYPNVYESCLKHVLKEYAGEWTQKSDERKDKQFVRVESSVGEIFFRRFKVQEGRQDVERCFISQNVNTLKSDERNTIFTMQQEIIDAKDNLEDFLREVGWDETFQLEELMIGITEQESPYMK